MTETYHLRLTGDEVKRVREVASSLASLADAAPAEPMRIAMETGGAMLTAFAALAEKGVDDVTDALAEAAGALASVRDAAGEREPFLALYCQHVLDQVAPNFEESFSTTIATNGTA